MRILKSLFLITIFLLNIDKVVNYIHVEILKDGGYTGLFCMEQEYIQDEVFKCVKRNSKCKGIGKPEWYDPKVPMSINYYKGTIYSCTVDCNFNEDYTRIHGNIDLFYHFIKKTLSVINITNYVKNGESFSANIKYLNLIDPSNVTLKFGNPLFNYTNLSINKNELKCTLQVNDDKVYYTKFISKVSLLYGNDNCTKILFLGYVFLYKEYFDVEKYIEMLKNEKLQLKSIIKKLKKEPQIKKLKKEKGSEIKRLKKEQGLIIKKLKKEHGLEIKRLKKEQGSKIESLENNLTFYLNKTNEEKLLWKNTIFKSNTSTTSLIIVFVVVVILLVSTIVFLMKKRKFKFQQRNGPRLTYSYVSGNEQLDHDENEPLNPHIYDTSHIDKNIRIYDIY